MKPRILVADDEIDVLNLVASKLVIAGFDVHKSEDGSAALESARMLHPDLIVLDKMMPGMTGIEVCRALKSEPATSRIPIVILTAHGAESDRITALELGADDYITKPFSPRELVLRVQAILRRTACEDVALFNGKGIQSHPLEAAWTGPNPPDLSQCDREIPGSAGMPTPIVRGFGYRSDTP